MQVRRASRRVTAVVVPALLATSVGLAWPQPARAADCLDATWTGSAANGQWGDAANWSTGTVPGPDTRAILGSSATGLAGTVCGLTLTGGPSDAPVTVAGALQVTGVTALAGAVRADPAGASILVGALDVSGDGAQLQEIGLTLSGPIDLRGRLLTVTGAATTVLASGATVQDTVGSAGAALDLATPLTTNGTVTVSASARLRLLTGAAKSLAGVLDNRGTLVLGPGTTLTGTTEQAQLLNSGTVSVPTGTGVLDAVAVIGSGTLTAGTSSGTSSARLHLTRSAWTAQSPSIVTSQLQPGTTLRGGGVIQVGMGAAVAAAGIVNLVEGSILELDDDADGTAARIDASSATLVGVLAGTETNGTFHWRSGQVRGQLTVDKLRTEAGSTGNDNGTVNGRQLRPLDDVNRTRLTVLGPLVMQSARVVVQPRSDVVVSGATTFKLVGGFTAGNTDSPDATATLTTTATLTVAPSTIELFGTLPSAGVFEMPLVNAGAISVSGGSSLAAGRVVNQGSIVLNNGSMTATKGYVQEKPAGSTTDPTTAIATIAPTTEKPNPPPSTLSAATSTISINGGGLYGNGTLKAASTTVLSGWMRPFVSETSPGKLRVEGDLVLGAGSDLQTLVGPVDASSTANPKPVLTDRVEVTGAATLGGRSTGLSRSGYSPAYLTTATGVLTAATVSGTFASSAFSPSSSGLGWKPVYRAGAVDLQFVDVSAPALGLAGIPVFTPLTTQRITYFGVDNKTGVKSFDIRYKRSSPAALGPWTYPSGWQNRSATFVDHAGLAAGWTYCYSVRVRDRVGNTTNWSQPVCTTRMADDRSWSAAGRWSRPGGEPGFQSGTFSRSTTAGSVLRTSGMHTRVAVTALRCPTCGVMDVYSGSTRLARVDLRASSSALRTWISPVLSSRTATVMVRVVAAGRPVVIDAVALQRK